MVELEGSIYFRDNPWFKQQHVIKMGITSNIKDRSNTYITGEIDPGEYILVIKIPIDKMNHLDKIAKRYFDSKKIYRGGGTEFYNRNIMNEIIPLLDMTNTHYRVLNKDEISLINRRDRRNRLINILKQKLTIEMNLYLQTKMLIKATTQNYPCDHAAIKSRIKCEIRGLHTRIENIMR